MDWTIIVGFSDYSVSSCGLIRSNHRFVSIKQKNGKLKLKPIKERILKPALSGNGYEFVTLRKNGKHFNKRVHKLVAEHFCEGNKKGLVVHHKDGDKQNNDYTNLEFTTKQKNTQKYFESIGKRRGYVPIGDIPDLINRINNGEEVYKVAKEYNVTRNDLATLARVISLTGEELTIKEI